MPTTATDTADTGSTSHSQPSAGYSKGRIEALSDGVFAIAITLLVLEIHIPRATQVPPEQLPAVLLSLWPEAISYALSFAIIGIYWVAHHLQMHLLRHVDRPMLWLNLLFLLFITIIPLSADLLGQYSHERIAVSLYGLNLVLASTSMLVWWRYATRDGTRWEGHATEALVRIGVNRTAVAIGIYGAATVVAWINPQISLVIFWLGPVFYIVMQTKMGQHLARRAQAGRDDR